VTLNGQTGLVSGTPSVAGAFDITLRAADSATNVATQTATIAVAPGAFNKTSPANSTTRLSGSSTTLRWGTSSGATNYRWCVDTTNDNACGGTWTATTSTSASFRITSGTTYYWQVVAFAGPVTSASTPTAQGNGGTWWTFRR
jgi:hypothetical protein